MPYSVLPVLLFVVCAVALAVGLVCFSWLFNPSRPSAVRQMPYESGMDPVHDTRRRFDVRFHLVAIAFLVFDVELLFLYPWAVAWRPAAAVEGRGERGEGRGTVAAATPGSASSVPRPSPLAPRPSVPAPRPPSLAPTFQNRDLVFAGVMTFLLLLMAGYVYDWRRGVFRWR
jgi:NADH-quinone oxidoreductase subunit A